MDNIEKIKNSNLTKTLIESVDACIKMGQKEFYSRLLKQGLLILSDSNEKIKHPENIYLEAHDILIILHRNDTSNNILYKNNLLEVAALYRKAAHKMYRVMLKTNLTTYNKKFLQLV